MKQRIRVSAICKKEGEILLLKRANGRVNMGIEYELPTGKLIFGEQPEEAMARAIYEYTGVRAKSLQLIDAVTFTNLRDASEQGNLFIIYNAELENDSIKITSERYGAYKWANSNDIENLELEEATRMVLQITAMRSGVASARVVQFNNANNENEQVSVNGYATVFTDGGSRGNPGPSGAGYYILGSDGKELKRGGEFLGFSSSRLAEYYGLKEGIEQAIDLGLKRVSFKSDSLMLVNQMNGIYKVKNPDLFQVHTDVLHLLEKFDSYSFTHVPREQNREADLEVNKVIDANMAHEEF